MATTKSKKKTSIHSPKEHKEQRDEPFYEQRNSWTFLFFKLGKIPTRKSKQTRS